MPTAIIIHGAFGHSKENWFPWLKKELEANGYTVFVPDFPTPKNQSLQNWLKIFKQYEQKLTKDSVVIGHSLGVPFLLKVIENLSKPIRAAFFVAGFASQLGQPKVDELNKSFLEKPFNWEIIKKKCPAFYVFYSNNDPYVSEEKSEELIRNLNAESIFIKEAGHFNETAGYTTFNQLLEKIKTYD